MQRMRIRTLAFLMVAMSSVICIGAEAAVVDLGTFDGHQYFFDTGSFYSFEDARQAARTVQNRDLVSIASEAENIFLAAAIAAMPNAGSNLRTAWIGLSRTATSDPWMWVNGESASYFNWRPAWVKYSWSEPTGETVGVMYVNESGIPTGLWADTDNPGSEPFNAIYKTVNDLAGTWYFQVFGDRPSTNAPYWGSGTMILDSTGAVTGGTAVNDSGGTQALNGGSFVIDSAGQAAGTVTFLSGGIESLPYGTLDAGRTILTMVNTDSYYRGLFMALKGGGTFTQQDLAGTWYYEVYFDNPTTNAPMWGYGTMVVDAGGTVTGGTATNSDGYTDTLVGGSLAIDSAGLVSGTMLQANGIVQSLPHGKLDKGKNFLAMVNSSTSVLRGLFVAARGGGTFTQVDLAGTWHIQAFGDNKLTNAPYWGSGTMVLDSTGTVTGGTAINDSGVTKTLNGGSFTIDSAGQVAGTLTLSDGTVESFPHGKLNAGKTLLTMVNTESPQNNRGLFVAAKGGMAGTCSGDFASDGDVDGSDLAVFITNTSMMDLATFARNFGKSMCQ
jgi:hypothetical protein